MPWCEIHCLRGNVLKINNRSKDAINFIRLKLKIECKKVYQSLPSNSSYLHQDEVFEDNLYYKNITINDC